MQCVAKACFVLQCSALEWTCNVHLSKGPGELASPSWPENYPPSIRCSWRLTAPPGQRVHLHVTAFDLEEHALGHCNDHYDHVRILDGGTVTSTKIGLYCGRHKAFSVRSTGRDMFVQFVSDHDPNSSKQGFHAIYQHEKSHNGNDSSLPTSQFDGTATGWEEVKLDQDKNSTGKEHVESSTYRLYLLLAFLLSCSCFEITSKEPVCPRVELILKIIIILLIIFLGFIKSKPC